MMDGRTGKARRWLAAVGLTGVLMLGGCAADDGYGYGGVGVGTGYYGGGGYYNDGYYGGGYQPSAFGGWYSDYYYPGSGYYVYDRGGRRHRWNDRQRSYWEGRRAERRDDWRGRDDDGRNNGWRGQGQRPDNWRNDSADGRRDRDGRGYDGRPNGTPGQWRDNAARPQWRVNGPRVEGQRAIAPRVERQAQQPGVRQVQPRVVPSGRDRRRPQRQSD